MTGKEKCILMKRIRARIAEENGIEGFEFKECPSKGECLGTCPACDKETEDLQKALEEKGVSVVVPKVSDAVEFVGTVSTDLPSDIKNNNDIAIKINPDPVEGRGRIMFEREREIFEPVIEKMKEMRETERQELLKAEREAANSNYDLIGILPPRQMTEEEIKEYEEREGHEVPRPRKDTGTRLGMYAPDSIPRFSELPKTEPEPKKDNSIIGKIRGLLKLDKKEKVEESKDIEFPTVPNVRITYPDGTDGPKIEYPAFPERPPIMQGIILPRERLCDEEDVVQKTDETDNSKRGLCSNDNTAKLSNREKCEKMKRLREQISAYKNIKGFEYKECTYKGECNEFCVECKAEEELFEKKMKEKEEKRRLQNKEIVEKQKSMIKGSPDLIPLDSTISYEAMEGMRVKHLKYLTALDEYYALKEGKTIHKLKTDEMKEEKRGLLSNNKKGEE